MSHLINKNKLLYLLKNEIKKYKRVVIQAGHFALVHDINDPKILIPGVYQDIIDKFQKMDVKRNPYMGDFPLETFKLGVSLIKFASNNNIHFNLIILINDWQWVKSVDFGVKNKYRLKYYKNPQLPVSFIKLLNKNNISINSILPLKNTNNKKICAFFSETKLRNQYDNHYKFNSSEVICNLNNKCAQEQIPLFNQLSKYDVDLFINFIPKSCITSTIAATDAFLKTNNLKIINIFTNGNKKEIKSNLEISL